MAIEKSFTRSIVMPSQKSFDAQSSQAAFSIPFSNYAGQRADRFFFPLSPRRPSCPPLPNCKSSPLGWMSYNVLRQD